MSSSEPILVTGGHRLRAMARSPERPRCRRWGGHEKMEIAVGETLDRDTFVRAAKGCGTAYYLIHSLECRLKSHTAFGGVGKMLSSLHWLRRR